MIDSKTDSKPARMSIIRWMLLLLPFGYLWFRLIDNLRVEWSTDPEYAFGWVVPWLCLGLILRKWQGLRELNGQKSERDDRFSIVFLFGLLAFLYLPTRLIEAATPEWRPIQWLLGIEAIGLTLCAIWLGKGRGWLRQLAFPIAFFFVAIPWPSAVEQPIIQNLTRASAAIVIEMLGWADVPAMAHGNVIEVSTGMVGIDEACSGIRSFQSSLMISLFFGEFYSLSVARRWLLVPLGFAFSMGFNVIRMFLLTLIAAKKGVPAIAQYHDPAGITIAIICTLALWGIAWLFLKSQQRARTVQKVKSDILNSKHLISVNQPLTSDLCPSSFRLSRFSLTLLAWLVVVESGVWLWYYHLESHIKPGPAWSLDFPKDNATLKELPISADTRYLLRNDEGKQAAWTEADGTQWQAYYFSWLPGRVAGYLAKRHTPEICLQATGLKMISGPKLTMVKIHGVELPIRSYVFDTADGPIQVFHCRWEAGADESDYVQNDSARFNLVRGIWTGRGNKGQKVIEIIISGMDDPVQAKAALVRELDKLIKVGNQKSS